MSEIKVNSIKGVSASTAAISIDNSSGSATANLTTVNSVTMPNEGSLSGRRMNINGACLVNQRGNKTGLTSGSHKVLDRWRHYFTEGTFSITQENDAPSGSGFTKSLKIQCTTADTSQDAFATHQFGYAFEGQDIQQLAKGTSSAKQLAVQFWCKAYQTGTFVVTCFDEDNARFVCQNFTISASNTWEHKKLTFPADTTGTITADNSKSINIDFKLASGSNYTGGTLRTAWGGNVAADSAVGQTVNIADNTNNNFYITGFQIEVGNVHTEFEHRSFGQELQLCQRYYQVMKITTAMANTTTQISFSAPLFCKMRANPSIGKTSGNFKFGDMVATGVTSSNTPTIDSNFFNHYIAITGGIGGFSPNMTVYRLQKHEPSAGNVALITADAEL